MKIYRNSIYILIALTIISFAMSLIIHYNYTSREAEFWCNIIIGIFSGALLTLITSIVGYRVERRKVLENFSYYTKRILRQLNKYQEDMSLEQKVDFFLQYSDSDKIEWDSCLGEINFFADYKRKNFLYIYNSIYKPLLDINNAIQRHYWNFQYYKDGSARVDRAIIEFISEIEPMIITKKIEQIPAAIDKNGKVISYTERTVIYNRIVEDLLNELNGKYYKLIG